MSSSSRSTSSKHKLSGADLRCLARSSRTCLQIGVALDLAEATSFQRVGLHALHCKNLPQMLTLLQCIMISILCTVKVISRNKEDSAAAVQGLMQKYQSQLFVCHENKYAEMHVHPACILWQPYLGGKGCVMQQGRCCVGWWSQAAPLLCSVAGCFSAAVHQSAWQQQQLPLQEQKAVWGSEQP